MIKNGSVEIEYEWFCKSIKGHGKITKARPCRLFQKIRTFWRRKQDTITVLSWLFSSNLVFPSSSRTFRTQSHLSYVAGQCHSVLFFPLLLPCRMCNQFTLNLSNRQTISFLLVDQLIPKTNHKDSETNDWNEQRHAQFIHSAWEKHWNAVCWFDINIALKKGLKFHQTRSNAIVFTKHYQFFCVPKDVKMEIGEVKYKKVYTSSRFPLKISSKHDWMKALGSEVAERSHGQVVQLKRSQSSQPNPIPDHDNRTGKPDVCRDGSHALKVTSPQCWLRWTLTS